MLKQLVGVLRNELFLVAMGPKEIESVVRVEANAFINFKLWNEVEEALAPVFDSENTVAAFDDV